MNTSKTVVTVVLVGALVGCGGGGDGGSATTDPALTFNMDAAVANALSQGATFSGLQGTLAGQSLRLSLSYAPAADGSFQGQTRKRAIQTVSVTNANNVALAAASSTIFFGLGPARLIGGTNSQGQVTVYEQRSPLPIAGTVGSLGTWALSTTYTSSSLSVVVGTATAAWSLETDAGSFAWACLTFTAVASGQALTEKDCFRINQAGVISGAKATLTIGGETATFQ